MREEERRCDSCGREFETLEEHVMVICGAAEATEMIGKRHCRRQVKEIKRHRENEKQNE